MPLHIIKLCVGVETVEELEDWLRDHFAAEEAAGRVAEDTHVTRMMPKRAAEVLDGGSLYWVIRGFVQVRQRIVDIRPVTDDAGTERCALVMEPVLHRTRLQPRRPFQGWRYLTEADAPADLARAGADDGAIPPEMRRDLSELGLI
jgi:hypothetical protein